ncbi:universal stress protein [Marinilabiliaceae bacterium ANBcel2]|nr:universal stress protein [Marinilabiliaceae bacterium ANBcel2]
MIKILVPVNFSDYSLNAISYALTLAEKFPAEVIILHCFSNYVPLNEQEKTIKDVDKVVVERVEKEEKDSQQKLKELTNSFIKSLNQNQNQNIDITYKFEYGYPEDVIPLISKELSADVIIMGTKCKGDTIKEALGSITGDVMQKVSAPVLAVPSHSTINLSRIGKVMFLIELNQRDYISLHRLIRIISPFQTQINVVYYTTGKADKNDIRKMEMLHTYCDVTYRNYNINFDIITGKNFIKTVDEYLEENSIDIIAMTRRKRTVLRKLFSPSVTRKMLFNTDIPLLIFHS